jgi:hypothetical protein
MSASRVLIVLLIAAAAAAAAPSPHEARPPRDDAELQRWLQNMVWHHGFTTAEIQAATGLGMAEIESACARLDIRPETKPRRTDGRLLVLPYPGGRHPRIGFLDGAIDPQRETKVSVFTPWDDTSYVVWDIPEAIWHDTPEEPKLLYLAHTHFPTIWTERGVELEREEWQTRNGGLVSRRELPNGVAFETYVDAEVDGVRAEIVLRNGTDRTLTGLGVQHCVMFKGVRGFTAQTNDNKVLRAPFAAAHSQDGRRWVITVWEPAERVWANPDCPCMHSDPRFPDCPPGGEVRIRGWLSFYEGDDIDAELHRIAEQDGWSPPAAGEDGP